MNVNLHRVRAPHRYDVGPTTSQPWLIAIDATPSTIPLIGSYSSRSANVMVWLTGGWECMTQFATWEAKHPSGMVFIPSEVEDLEKAMRVCLAASAYAERTLAARA